MKLDLPGAKEATLSRVDVREDAEISQHPLRTLTIVGVYNVEPTLDRPFHFFSTPLVADRDYRMISTSTVKSIEKVGQKYRFHTLNSTYVLEPITVKS